MVSAIVPGQCSFLDLEKPARTGQIFDTLASMGRKAKLTVKLATHDVRRGAAKDIAHLGEETRGFATPTVAAALGHRVSSFMQDVTASYTGESDASIWTMRAESGFKHRQAPMVGQRPFVATNPNRDEVQEYCTKKGLDADESQAPSCRGPRRSLAYREQECCGINRTSGQEEVLDP